MPGNIQPVASKTPVLVGSVASSLPVLNVESFATILKQTIQSAVNPVAPRTAAVDAGNSVVTAKASGIKPKQSKKNADLALPPAPESKTNQSSIAFPIPSMLSPTEAAGSVASSKSASTDLGPSIGSSNSVQTFKSESLREGPSKANWNTSVAENQPNENVGPLAPTSSAQFADGILSNGVLQPQAVSPEAISSEPEDDPADGSSHGMLQASPAVSDSNSALLEQPLLSPAAPMPPHVAPQFTSAPLNVEGLAQTDTPSPRATAPENKGKFRSSLPSTPQETKPTIEKVSNCVVPNLHAKAGTSATHASTNELSSAKRPQAQENGARDEGGTGQSSTAVILGAQTQASATFGSNIVSSHSTLSNQNAPAADTDMPGTNESITRKLVSAKELKKTSTENFGMPSTDIGAQHLQSKTVAVTPSSGADAQLPDGTPMNWQMTGNASSSQNSLPSSADPAAHPQTHTEIPNPSPAIAGFSKLMDLHGRAELHVAVPAGEFGSVNIRTSMTRNELTAQISVERSDLGKILAADLPALQNRLAEHRLPNTNLILQNASGGGSHANQDQPPQPQLPQVSNFHSTPDEPVRSPEVLSTEVAGSGTRLDIHM